jgi:hypothetical protein
MAIASAADENAPNRYALSSELNRTWSRVKSMPKSDQQARLEEAFERIEETILPCISMMLETLIDASEHVAADERRFLVGELKTLAAELEELTKTVERSSPNHLEPGEYKARSAA